MTKLTATLLGATYKVIDGRPVIHLFLKTGTGERVCAIDKRMRPYFYVEPKKDPAGLTKVLTGLALEVRGEDYKVVDVSKVTLPLHGQEKSLLKVVTNIPAAVPHIKKEVAMWDAVENCYEYDIRFCYKYLMEKGITPLQQVSLKGNEVRMKGYEGRVIEIADIGPASEQQAVDPRVLAVDIETYNPEGKTIDMEKNPILMIALYGKDLAKVIIAKQVEIKDRQLAERVECVKDEAEMIKRMGEIIKEYGPDIITGYNSDGFDLPYIKKRARKLKVELSLGVDGSGILVRGTSRTTASFIGPLHIDIFIFIRRVMGLSMRTQRFSLDSVAEELLGKNKIEVKMNRLAGAWDESSDEELEEFARYNLRDAELTYLLHEHAFPLLVEVTRIVGQSPENVSRMSFSQLVEWFIMKRATDRAMLIPSRPSFSAAEARSKEHVIGGFVYKPEPGLYTNLAVFDFRSLYPTILASHNISIDMLNKSGCKAYHDAPVEGKNIKFCADEPGFLAEIMKELILARKKIKTTIKEEGKTPVLYARSQALKYLCNSFYGYLGFSQSRWYSMECAAAITSWGRHYIQGVIKKAKEEGFNVVYGDTDSVFLGLNEKDKQQALDFLKGVNTTLPEFMELEVEGFYRAGIFVSTKSGEGGAKKRYALIDEKQQMKIAGFELVRRNTSPIAKEVQKKVLEILLKDQDVIKAQSYVRSVIEDLRQHKIEKEQVTIFTQLTRDIHEYEAKGPHVAAAIRMQDRGDRVGARTYIYYIVCKGAGRIRDKVKLPDEVTKDDYDPEYYINNQVLPAVERIFDALGTKAEDLKSKQSQSSLGSFFS